MFSHAAADKESVRFAPQNETVSRAARLPAHKPGRRAMTAVHRRTLEALALAIGAHGGQTPGQLLGVAAYAREIGRRMGLKENGLEALHAASLLHDAGELALPHQVMSGVGELTPEVREKLKLHPIIGAEIVERIGFPFPVAPLVRAHHERWDGKGYPDGLQGEAIPLGARILAVAVCLASRLAKEALECLCAGVGRVFDPAVVELVTVGFVEIERAVRLASDMPAPLGYEIAIQAARREERVLSELTGELGNSLKLHETLCALDGRLKRLVAYDSIAYYVPREECLLPAYVSGENSQQLCSLEIPFGHGIPGRAAESRQPIMGGDASLASVLAVPLQNDGELIGVLALYHAAANAFSPDDLRILQSIRPKLTVALDNARKHEHAEQCSVVDPVSGLPNGRALFLRLDAELARCRRTRSKLAVLVCEMAGIERLHPLLEPAATRHLLQTLAAGLRRICREDDCVARQGDGFVLVLSGFGPRDLKHKRKLIEALIRETANSKLDGPLAARLGAAFYPEDGSYAEDLLAAADRRLNHDTPPAASPKIRFGPELVELAAALDRAGEPEAIPGVARNEPR